MSRRVLALALSSGLLPVAATGGPEGHPAPALNCKTGPVSKAYGGTPWLVYSCDDDRTVVVVSVPGSPAAPFYFILSPAQDGYDVRGEGTGANTATAPAYKDLSVLSDTDIATLIAATKHKPAGVRK